jgi:hypothetical protein
MYLNKKSDWITLNIAIKYNNIGKFKYYKKFSHKTKKRNDENLDIYVYDVYVFIY